MPQFLAPVSHSGLLVRGNIDLDVRKYPLVRNKDGSISSVRSASFSFLSSDDTGKIHVPPTVRKKVKKFEILVPTTVHTNGRWQNVGFTPAINFALSTGRHLGVFDTPAHANVYASALHNYLARFALKRKRRR